MPDLVLCGCAQPRWNIDGLTFHKDDDDDAPSAAEIVLVHSEEENSARTARTQHQRAWLLKVHAVHGSSPSERKELTKHPGICVLTVGWNLVAGDAANGPALVTHLMENQYDPDGPRPLPRPANPTVARWLGFDDEVSRMVLAVCDFLLEQEGVPSADKRAVEGIRHQHSSALGDGPGGQ